MSQVIQIGIHGSKGDEVRAIDTVEAVKGKGLVNNRHFKENNEKRKSNHSHRNRKYQLLQQNIKNSDRINKF